MIGRGVTLSIRSCHVYKLAFSSSSHTNIMHFMVCHVPDHTYMVCIVTPTNKRILWYFVQYACDDPNSPMNGKATTGDCGDMFSLHVLPCEPESMFTRSLTWCSNTITLYCASSPKTKLCAHHIAFQQDSDFKLYNHKRTESEHYNSNQQLQVSLWRLKAILCSTHLSPAASNWNLMVIW